MAVFPDRIVLKSSTDSPNSIISEIGAEGSSPIIRGEIVVSVQDGYAELYTVDSNGTIVGAASQTIALQGDVELSPTVENSSILAYDAVNGKWRDAAAPPFSIGGNNLSDLGNVSASTAYQGAVLSYSEESQEWGPYGIKIAAIEDVLSYDKGTMEEGQVLKWVSVSTPIYDEEGQFLDLYTELGWATGYLDYYTDITNAPGSVSDLGVDIGLEDLVGVDFFMNPAAGDVLTYDGTEWTTASAPPVDISGSSITGLTDVSDFPDSGASTNIGKTLRLRYDENQRPYFEIAQLKYEDIAEQRNSLSDYANDLTVSAFPNDAQYISIEDGFDLEEVSDVNITDPQQSQILIYRSEEWVNDYGPPADIRYNSVGDLLDVTYFQPGNDPGILTIENLGQIVFDSPAIGSGYFYRNIYNNEYGLGLEALRSNDLSGSAVYADRSRGVTLRSDVNLVRLTGRPTTITNQPEIRFESGDNGGDTSTGAYIGFKMPPNVEVTESLTYLLPLKDGDFGDVLVTDGEGGMSWVTSAAGATNLGELQDVDVSTIPPVDGQALIYNNELSLWMPGDVSDVDISSASLGDLSDVNLTDNPPEVSQGLVWDGTEWSAGSVSSVVTWVITSNTSTGQFRYSLTGAGLDGPTNNPDLYVFRGQLYKFDKPILGGGGGHPFQLEDASGAVYTDGVSGSQPMTAGTLAWEVPLDAPTTLYYQCTDHPSMRGTIHVLSEAVVASINDLTDVDTLSTAPSTGDVLEWNGVRWGPAAPSAGGGAGVDRTSETQTSTGGLATFSAIGRSGVLVSISSTEDAWVTLYSTQSARTADGARIFEEDPIAGSGILAEIYTSGGGTITATPGTTYFNAESESPDEIYASIRTKAGAPVVSDITVQAFPIASGSNSGVSVAELKYIMGQSSTFEDFKALILAM